MIIILGGDFLNQTFFPFKNKMPNIYSFSYKFLKVVVMSSATKSMTFEEFLLGLKEVFFILNHIIILILTLPSLSLSSKVESFWVS